MVKRIVVLLALASCSSDDTDDTELRQLEKRVRASCGQTAAGLVAVAAHGSHAAAADAIQWSAPSILLCMGRWPAFNEDVHQLILELRRQEEAMRRQEEAR